MVAAMPLFLHRTRHTAPHASSPRPPPLREVPSRSVIFMVVKCYTSSWNRTGPEHRVASVWKASLRASTWSALPRKMADPALRFVWYWSDKLRITHFAGALSGPCHISSYNSKHTSARPRPWACTMPVIIPRTKKPRHCWRGFPLREGSLTAGSPDARCRCSHRP